MSEWKNGNNKVYRQRTHILCITIRSELRHNSNRLCQGTVAAASVSASVAVAVAAAALAHQQKQIEWVNKREKDSRKLYSSFMFVPSRTQTERIWVHDWTESERVGKKHVFIIITDKICYRVGCIQSIYFLLLSFIHTCQSGPDLHSVVRRLVFPRTE